MSNQVGTLEKQEHEELGPVGLLGAAAIDLYIGGRELYSVFVRTLFYTVRGRREKGALVQQMYEIGNKSIFFISTTMGFLGMILVYQAGLQAKRVVPDYTMLGATYLELLVRDFAASIGALMLATRVASMSEPIDAARSRTRSSRYEAPRSVKSGTTRLSCSPDW